jgi:hypothetical protein
MPIQAITLSLNRLCSTVLADEIGHFQNRYLVASYHHQSEIDLNQNQFYLPFRIL